MFAPWNAVSLRMLPVFLPSFAELSASLVPFETRSGEVLLRILEPRAGRVRRGRGGSLQVEATDAGQMFFWSRRGNSTIAIAKKILSTAENLI